MIDQAAFDWRYGTETADFMVVENLAIGSPHKSLRYDYQPSTPREFRRIIGNLPQPLSDFTFVDFGCGKGRILFLAAQAGFRNIVGVEFSPALVKIAKQNIAIFQHCVPQANLHVVCADAADFPIPPDDCVLYFYNPFGKEVMQNVVENVRRSYNENPRSIHIALKNCAKLRLP